MIKSLYLKNFRNFSDFHFTPSRGINLVTGANGTGKTSILEAIYYSSRFESFRTKDPRDLIHYGKDAFFVRCECKSTKIEVGYDGKRKKVKKDGIYYRSYTKLYGQIPVVIFLPEDILVVSGPPETKRAFINSAIGLISPFYRTALRDYRQILKNRNNLIRKIKEGTERRENLYTWNKILVEKGSFIIEERAKFIELLLPYVRVTFNRFTQRDIGIEYINKSGTGDKFFRKLAEGTDKELYAGYTLYGPHRDTLLIKLDGRDASSYASYGFQRIIAFSLRMAETELVKRIREEEPVVMVDEVINELDRKNREVFMEVLSEYNQSILATVSQKIANFKNFNIFRLEKGK